MKLIDSVELSWSIVRQWFQLAKAAHFKDFICKNSTSSTKLWSHINPLINPNKKLIIQIDNEFLNEHVTIKSIKEHVTIKKISFQS